ncbi:sulfatase family protein [Ilumatobacter nonamiensis]|uniref:sulfatase family protein n=1 Tax=Ilumatobacter nonamiensis TaxID=467093 RepID=UPI0003483ADB|nr:sulfatase [Ilumatobacter nonamiensis]
MTHDRPNVVLINCDDLGYGDLGCYGSTRNDTPALDQLAADGIRFDSFYTASPVCSPARGALLTGCYPPRIGFGSFHGLPVLFPGMDIGLPPTEISIAKVLSDAGYATQAIGKWHCGDQPHFQPTNHGFDHYLGLPYSNDMGRQAGRPEFMPEMPPLPLISDGEVVEQQPDQTSLTDRYVTEALDFIRRSNGQPFFLYLAHMYVHVPIYVQDRFAEASSNGAYGAAVAAIDWATSVILDELDARGIAENTIVIFTSDNGSLGDNPPPFGSGEPLGASNDPLRGTKGTTWEGGQRVPGIIRWPKRIAPGRTSDAVLTAMDLFPTLATLCGADVPTDRTIDGHDISALLFDDDVPSPHDAFFYYWMNDLEALRSGRWKLHFSKRGTEHRALYDLDTDIGETTDIIDDHPDVVARLDAVAETARATMGDARLGREGSDVRPIGRVDDAAPLTTYDPAHPYVVAEYDLPDRG